MHTQHNWNRVLFTAALTLLGLSTCTTAQIQNWSLASPVGAVPAPRAGHAMVYDPTHGRMVMFGGGTSSGVVNDVWEFDVGTKTWTNVTPSSGPYPAPRNGHAMAYDPVRDKVVMHGGSTAPFAHPGETWEWDTVTRSWTYMPAGTIGPGTGLLGSVMAFDPNRNQVIMFGGRNYFDNGGSSTYAWNGTSWIDITPPNSPAPRAYHMMATDTARSKVVLFGGWQGNLLQDIWEWDGGTWTEIPTAVKPLERHLSGMSYDSERGSVVLFGGWNGYAPNYPWNDTWTWNGLTWTLQQPCDVPSPRNSVAMAYDPVSKRHVMFGGGGSSGLTNETWLYGTGLGSFPCGDSIAPATTASSTTPNAEGWNQTDVAVQLQASDGEDGTGVQELTFSATGANPVSPTTVSGAAASFTVTAEGETVISFYARDNAGNVETTQTLTVRIDRTPPTFTCDSPGGFWHASNVDLPCSANDSVSGLDNAANGSFNLITSVAPNNETTNATTDSRAVCDQAGNCQTAGPIGGIMIDRKAPQISVISPTAGSYLLNQAVLVNYSCTDGGSGVATCAGTTANGNPLDTSSAGSKVFSVSSSDAAGNTASSSVVDYVVAFAVEALYDQAQAHKSGSTVPIKLRIVDANGLNVSDLAIVLHAVSVVQVSTQATGDVADAGNSNPDFDFRFDANLDGYIFNLKTSRFQTGGYLLNFTVGNLPMVYSVGFHIRQ